MDSSQRFWVSTWSVFGVVLIAVALICKSCTEARYAAIAACTTTDCLKLFCEGEGCRLSLGENRK